MAIYHGCTLTSVAGVDVKNVSVDFSETTVMTVTPDQKQWSGQLHLLASAPRLVAGVYEVCGPCVTDFKIHVANVSPSVRSIIPFDGVGDLPFILPTSVK